MPARRQSKADAGRIRVGIGGWTFEPWRGVFYPKGLAHARELEYASSKLTSIEINGTFYRTQKPSTFIAWRNEVPEDFVFALKAPRYATHRRVLAEAGDSVGRFLDSGLTELGPKLGPILWQLMPTAKFDADDMQHFLDLLPAEHGGQRIRHTIEVRHESFATPAFVKLLRERNIAVVIVASDKHTPVNDVTADFVYLRIEHAQEKLEEGYPPAELDAWTKRLRAWAEGGAPKDLKTIEKPAAAQPRDVFAYFISAAKVRNPAAAMAVIARLKA
jgi:uncharacterized protein YecE (DUF72 family)